MTAETCDILVTSKHHQQIMKHLYPGDHDEYGAILRAGVVRNGSSMRLLVQNVQPAEFGTDYVPGQYGYRALTPTFIHREIIKCRDSGLATSQFTTMEVIAKSDSVKSISIRINAGIRRSSILAAEFRLVL